MNFQLIAHHIVRRNYGFKVGRFLGIHKEMHCLMSYWLALIILNVYLLLIRSKLKL
jgi:hypothetical protein